MLGNESRVLLMPGKYSISELHPQPNFLTFKMVVGVVLTSQDCGKDKMRSYIPVKGV
jgi:hypothetical protein